MATKGKVEETVDYSAPEFSVDDETVSELPTTEVVVNEREEPIIYDKPLTRARVQSSAKATVSCLRNEKITVRHIPRVGMVTNPKHILYGGMAENAVRTFTVPVLKSGMYVNVLTNEEKAFLEEIMGLEYDALSIYRKKDNYWDNFQVPLHKQDNVFNLASPDDYIRYKVLLANKDYIAPSMQEMEDHFKATYQFVIISDGEEVKTAKDNMSSTMRCYKEFGKVENDVDILRTIIEAIDGRPMSVNTKLEFLQTKANELIQADSKMFLRVITDPMLPTKVLIKRAVEAGIISNRGGYLYLKSDNSPLCGHNEEPVLNIAAKYLNNPKNQELKFAIEAKLKE